MTWFRLFLLKLAVIMMLFEHLQVSGEKKVNLDAKMLEFGSGLYDGSTSYANAVDGRMGQQWEECAISATAANRVWLSINLGRLYSVSKIRMLSRLNYGSGAEIYVGKAAIKKDGTIDSSKDHQCGDTYPTTALAKTFTNFSCSSFRWIQYVTIYGPKYYLQVCEVEVYYNERTADGVAITTKNQPIRSLGEIASCGSPNGDFGPIWKFPNGTKVSTKTSAEIQQVKDSSSHGYKQLRLDSLTFIAPNGDYICEYIANNAPKTKTVNIVLDCQSTSWSACLVSCGRGKRTKIIADLKGSTCSSSESSKDCLNTNCDRIDMTNALATHGPRETFVGKSGLKLSASLAIDGEVKSFFCAATFLSTSPWLLVDLKTAYLITSVEASFWEDRGNGAIVRVGSNSTDNGNGNPKCGQPISNSASGMWITTVCSPPLWGRYINVQKTSSTKNYFLSVCELRASYKLDVGILYNDSSIASGSIYLNAGKPLPFPVLCGVNPDPTNFNELLNTEWKSGNRIPTLRSNPDIWQSKTSNRRSLHIEKAPLVDQKYSCHFTWINQTKNSLEFNLYINVDCTWNEWSECSGSCGVITRQRTADNATRRHQGKQCIGSFIEICNTKSVPCAPIAVHSKETVERGKQATLACEAPEQSGPIIAFEWFKNGANVTTLSSSSVLFTNGKFRGSLTLTSVKKSDASSLYTCKGRGIYGLSAPSAAITLNVTYASSNVKIRADSNEFLKGERLNLGCSAEANPPPQYSWQKNGVQLPMLSSQLSFFSLDYSDNGTYKCTARNSLGSSASSEFLLIVDGPPGECTKLSGTSAIGNNVTLTIQCLVNGNASVTKYRVFYRIPGLSEAWDSYIVATTSAVQIDVSDLIPFKKYEFKVSAGNDHGYGPNSSSTAVQTVEGEPGPPQNVTAIALGSYNISVSWLEPIDPKGGIAMYMVYYRFSSRAKRETAVHKNVSVVSGSHTTANLTDLFPFTKYSIEVAAVNVRQGDEKVLEGSKSDVISVQTAEAAPSAPSNLMSVSVTIATERITWSRPKQPNGIIREYVLFYWKVAERNDPDNMTITGETTRETISADIKDLEESVKYNVSVCAVTISRGPCESIIIRNNTKETKDDPDSSFGSGSGSDSGSDSGTAVAVAVVIVILAIAGIILAVIIVKRRSQKKKRETSAVQMSAMEHLGDDEDSPTAASLSVKVYEGSTALLSSNVTKNYEIRWYRGDTCLPGKDTRFQQLSHGELQITAVRSSDSGTYRRAVHSKAGVDEQIVELIVKPVELKEGRLGGFSGLAIGKSTRARPKTHAVQLDDFLDHVTAMNESRGSRFTEEFKELEQAGTEMELTTNAASSNVPKNRYKNILTYDHARVILKPVPGAEPLKCDYIAAAYVDGHCIPKKYIASQGPTKKTAGDMWRMIWTENVKVIVMLTHLIEGGKIKCYQYWPCAGEANKSFEGFDITLESVEEFAEYDIKSIRIVLVKEKETRYLKLYHFTAWPDHGVPKFATGLLGFIKRVNRELPKNAGPMVVHCSAGVGRTGTFIVIDQMLEKISEGLPIDVFSAVKSLRTRRQEMVQGEAQYAFIYVALLEAVLCGKTQIPVQNLRLAFSKLSEEDGKGRSGFERQFMVLQTTRANVNKALCESGLHPTVQKKNRYPEIVPLDTERVVLRLEEAGSGDSSAMCVNSAADYINASHVNGYRRQNAFIVTQGPLENTVNDFWKMVWEQDTYTIVNLTQLIEDGNEMCYQYWPQTKARYGSYKVEINSQISSDSYIVRKINVRKGSEVRTVCQFHFTAWPNDECPTSTTRLLEMMAQIEKWQQKTGNNVITVHCNNGIGRSGVFCTIVSVIEEMKVENVIDIFYKVKSLCIKRPGVVQNVDQYKFCYKAILDYTKGFDTYANFK